MFDYHAVRNRVMARLALFRNPSEEQTHSSYTKEIQEELTSARKAALELRSLLVNARCRRQDLTWVMLDRDDVKHFEKLIEDFLNGMR